MLINVLKKKSLSAQEYAVKMFENRGKNSFELIIFSCIILKSKFYIHESKINKCLLGQAIM